MIQIVVGAIADSTPAAPVTRGGKVGYQRDPRRAFIPMFDRMSRFDMMNQFVTHIGGGLFACPGGIRPGEFLGQRLLAA